MAIFEGRSCAARVSDAIDEGTAIVSAINLGEVLYRLERDYGQERAAAVVDRVRSHSRVEYPDWPTIVAAARVKARGGLSFADAFCVATAQRHDSPLWTGDPEILALAGVDLDVVDLR